MDRPAGTGRGGYGAFPEASEPSMRTLSRTVGIPCVLAGLLALAGCATARESIQECRKASYEYCAKKVSSNKDPASRGWGPEGAAREAAYQQCLDTQLAACGAP
jgi:hypothetical protein